MSQCRSLAWLFWIAPFALAQPSVDIRLSRPNTMPEMRVRYSHGRYELLNATLADLIRTAWSVDADKVVGGPDWIDDDRFDLTADVIPPEARKTILREILASRFGLQVHAGTMDVPAYTLTAGRKTELRPSDGSAAPGCEVLRSPVTLACRNITMEALSARLPGIREASGYLFNYPVTDKTGLTGAWDFDARFTQRIAQRPGPLTDETVTIFDALEKLGLRLERSQTTRAVIAVDRASKPTGLLKAEDAAPPRFEVATIKPAAPGTPCWNINIQPGGRVHVYMTLEDLEVEAWGAAIPPERIIWATGGLKSKDCFAVDAKGASDENAAAGWNGPVWNGTDIDTMRMMLRSLLVDRFKLVAHTEERAVPGYALTAGKLKLRAADPANRPGCREGPGPDGKDPRVTNPMTPRLFTCRNMTITRFAAELTRMFPGSPPFTDATGVAGRYDLTVNFTPGRMMEIAGSPGLDGASEPSGALSLAR